MNAVSVICCSLNANNNILYFLSTLRTVMHGLMDIYQLVCMAELIAHFVYFKLILALLSSVYKVWNDRRQFEEVGSTRC